MATKPQTVKAAVTLVKASKKAYTKKWSFLALFLLVLILSIGFASTLDILPDTQKTANAEQASNQAPAIAVSATPIVAIASAELPTKIEIPAINLSQTVSDPESTDVELLDNALLKGPVRYPTSAKLGEQGNVIIFGHSSYLPIVHNQAFKAFDGIQKLKQGDKITVTGSGHTYVYAVDTVEKKSATEDAIPLSVEGSKLTLATCDSFGEKTDRFVVTASLIETDPS